MVNIEEYTKRKFRDSGVTETYYDEIGFKRERPIFYMTLAYKKYLREKAEKEKQFEITVLKNKLEYQMKHYGEVDKYDYNEYVRLVQQSYCK